MKKRKSSQMAIHSIVNNTKNNLYLNVSIWAGSIMVNALDCRPSYLGSILSQSTDDKNKYFKEVKNERN